MVSVLGIGDNTVDIYVDQGVQFPGGNAVNVAVLMRRLGADAAYLGCIGHDILGDLVFSSLEAEKVDVSRVRRLEKGNAWSRIRHVNNERVFDGNNPNCRSDYNLTEDDYRWIGTFDLAHSSIYSKLEESLPAIHEAAQILSFDFSSDYSDAYLKEVAPHVDWAFLSAPDLDQADCKALADLVASCGPELVVITRGEHGAFVMDRGKVHVQSILPAEVVDTLGAGDAFISGFLFARLQGVSIRQQLYRAAAFGADACGHRGAFGYAAPIQPGQPGLPA